MNLHEAKRRRLRQLLTQAGESPNWLANRTRINRQNIYSWLEGTKPRDPEVWDHLIKEVSEYIDSKAERGTIGEHVREYEPDLQAPEPMRMVPLPILGSAAAGLTGSESLDDVIYVPIQFSFPDYRVARVTGDSMMPSLQHGDVVIFRQYQQPKPNAVMAVRMDDDGEIVIKEVRYSPDKGWILHSYNPDYPDLELERTATVRGYLVGIYRDDGSEMFFRHNRKGLDFYR